MSQMRFHDRDTFSSTKAQQFSKFLLTLFDANEYSFDLKVSPWNFAIGYNQLVNFDVNQNDLRWMIVKGWVASDTGSNENGAPELGFKLSEDARIVIAEHGIEIVREVLGRQRNAPKNESLVKTDEQRLRRIGKPNWDFERRELAFDGEIVKRFRWPAPNQETILSVFAEEDWPVKIIDPLPMNDIDPKRRLADTIKCLNRNQFCQLIRFRGDGTGEGVIWEDLRTTG